MWSRLRYKYHSIIDQRVFSVPPRAADPYATHLPILLLLSRLAPVHRVLELGSGMYSTLTFLNRRYFPELQALMSFENDEEWSRNILKAVGQDSRLQLVTVTGAIEKQLKSIDIDSYDLVLVDDSVAPDQRVKTIEQLALLKPERPFIVIHDYEFVAYRRAARAFSNRFRFTALNPNSGVVWNRRRSAKNALKLLNTHFHRLSEEFRVEHCDELMQWLKRIIPKVEPTNAQ